MMRSKPTITLRQARFRLLLQYPVLYCAVLADLLYRLTAKAGVDGGEMPTTVNSVSTSGSGSVWGVAPDAGRLSAGQVSTRGRALASTPVDSWILVGVEGLGRGTCASACSRGARAAADRLALCGQKIVGWSKIMSGVAAISRSQHSRPLAGSGCLLRACELEHAVCAGSRGQLLADFPSPAQSLIKQAGDEQQVRPTHTCLSASHTAP